MTLQFKVIKIYGPCYLIGLFTHQFPMPLTTFTVPFSEWDRFKSDPTFEFKD